MKDMWGFSALVEEGVGNFASGFGDLGTFNTLTSSGVGGFGRVMVPHS